MKPSPKFRQTPFSRRLRRQSAAVFASIVMVHTAPAAVTTWTGSGTDDNWSTSGNWDNGLPGGNDAVFAAADATGTSGSAGTSNNLVETDTSVLSLKYTNIQPGNHTTEIPTGATLTVNGTGNHIEVQSPSTGTNDIVYATILGDGTLAANNTAATLYIGQGAASSSTSRRATLDMSGLETFSAALGRIVIGQQLTGQPNRPQGTLRLARTNTLDLSGTPGILLGNIVSNNGNAANAQILELGTLNTIRSNSGMTIGGRKGNGYLRFNNQTVGEGEGSAVFRDLSGTGRQANWLIGDNSTQNGGGTFVTGVVDFSLYGGVDALVNVMILGRGTGQIGTNLTPSQGTLTFDKGIVDVNQLTLGIQNTIDNAGGQGTMNVDGTGNLTVNGNLTLGRFAGSTNETAHKALGLLNIGTISGGGAVTISGDIICGNAGGNKITLAAGSLTLGGKVGDDSVDGDAPLETLQLDGGMLTFDFGSSPNPTDSRIKVTTLNVPNSVTLNVKGTGLSPALPDIELIKYTTFDEAAQFANLSLVGMPLRFEAELVNNTANSSVDLHIISVSFNKWSGATNSDWDIDTTMNWKLAPADTPSTYLQTAVPGEPVTFDDSATANKTVNLTTALSPGALTVDTADTYTFNGTGSISGPTGITKRGTGSLVVGNSGTNDFTGGILIEGGKIRIAGSNDRLPINATVTLSDVANTELDLNGFHQSLLAINGGSTGGNVQLGTGSLTLTGAGSYAGVIDGGGSLTKTGTGNQVLSGANIFSGGTTITGGRITVANSSGSGLGSGPVVIGVDGSLSLGNGADTGSIAATIINSDGLLVINRSDDTTFDKMLIGTGGLTKTGDGTLWINAAKTYGGITTVSGGALRVSDDGALGTATDASIDGTNIGNGVTARLELSGDITLAEPIQLAQKQSVAGDAPGLVNVDGNNTLTGPLALGGGGSNWNIWSNAGKLSITGTATNTNTTNTRVIRFFGAGDGEILSVLADGAGTSLTAIVMNGGGTWRLAGTNTCTGPTTVETGNLQIDGNHTASTVTVNPSGTLSGTGTLGIATATGTIAPGAGIGTLNAATVTLSGTLAIEVAGSSSDRLDVSGTLDLTGATVSVSGTPTAGSYTLASAGSPITGTPVLAAPLSGYELLVEGNLLKLNSLGGGSPFESWATLNGAAPNLADDHDNDGVSNGIEYFLGGPNANTTGFTLLPGVSNTGGPLSITWIKGSGYTGTYGTDFRVETSDILSGSWTEETLIGGNVTDDPGFVKFIFPAPLDTKKFARLKVTGP